ncbi:MAG: HDIG domain-containing protein [Candidatus Poseidoniia archaeon]|nr:HDIG domain-containing protein [Candidatus Poseidoniia archaeon]MDP7243505.1 HDIG domain-containing protein [Candidatus Poseidoniia archaeon]MDP7535802.1 HDIG domain-containing protein [Candidatus Poseidoniia archaeon]MDP7607906.1 HDIG domain-containing protein [Candidatus Poseidoniia archaeon]
MKPHVLRIGHRPERDKRISTHVALTARAFGAGRLTLHRPDSRVVATVTDVVQRFGGDFGIATTTRPRAITRDWRGKVVHLTMFGTPLAEAAPLLRHERELLVVVGAERVPRWTFELADWNVAVGSQPHSEVAALAILLTELDSRWVQPELDGDLQVTPSAQRRRLATIPSADECLALHGGAGSPAPLLAHCCAVAEMAAAVTVALDGNIALANAGALLHDIGRNRAAGVEHCALGAAMAAEAGFHPGVAHIIRAHVGGGIPQREARALGLPPGDYLPRTLEARVVTACDNLHAGSRRRPLADCTAWLQTQGLEMAARRATRLHRWVSRRLGRDLAGF